MLYYQLCDAGAFCSALRRVTDDRLTVIKQPARLAVHGELRAPHERNGPVRTIDTDGTRRALGDGTGPLRGNHKGLGVLEPDRLDRHAGPHADTIDNGSSGIFEQVENAVDIAIVDSVTHAGFADLHC